MDDLLLDLPEPSAAGSSPLPEVVAIICGPFALSQNLPRPLQWLARQVYGLLGLPDPRPVEIPWSRVAAIDVVVHADIDRGQTGLLALEQAVYRRWIGRLPGASSSNASATHANALPRTAR